MRILLAFFLSLAVLGSIEASEGRKWSHYDKVTQNMDYQDYYYIGDNYQINLLVGDDGIYHAYLVHYKHHTFNMLTEVEWDLALKCFPFIESIKDHYFGQENP